MAVPLRTKLVDLAGLTEVHVRHQTTLLVVVGLVAAAVVVVALHVRWAGWPRCCWASA